MTVDGLNGLCELFYDTHIKVSIEQAKEIEQQTRLQSKCGLCRMHRRLRLTCLTFGEIMSCKLSTKV